MPVHTLKSIHKVDPSVLLLLEPPACLAASTLIPPLRTAATFSLHTRQAGQLMTSPFVPPLQRRSTLRERTPSGALAPPASCKVEGTAKGQGAWNPRCRPGS